MNAVRCLVVLVAAALLAVPVPATAQAGEEERRATHSYSLPGLMLECGGRIVSIAGAGSLQVESRGNCAKDTLDPQVEKWYEQVITALFEKWKSRITVNGQGSVRVTADANGIHSNGEPVILFSPATGSDDDVKTLVSMIGGTVQSAGAFSLPLPPCVSRAEFTVAFACDDQVFPRVPIEGIGSKYVIAGHELVNNNGERMGFSEQTPAKIVSLPGQRPQPVPLERLVNFADLTGSPAQDEKMRDVRSSWVDAPVFFATDRRVNERRSKSKYSGFGDDQVVGAQFGQFGVVHVALEIPEDFVDAGQLEKLGYTRISANAARVRYYSNLDQQLLRTAPAISSSPIHSHTSAPWNQPSFSTWLWLFSRAMDKAGSSAVPVFVHGCCVSRESSFEQAALLQLYLGCPVILFDWATVGVLEAPPLPELNAYRRSERALEISEINLRKFTEELLKTFKADQICLFSHSMGSRLLVSLLNQTSAGTRFGQVHMIRPDVNLQSYLLDEYRLVSKASKFYIYCADNDPWLAQSEGLSAGIPRLGRPGKLKSLFTETGLSRPSGGVLLDISRLHMEHDIPNLLVSEIFHHDLLAPGVALTRLSGETDRLFKVEMKDSGR